MVSQPIVQLLVFVDSEYQDSDVTSVHQVASELAADAREWVLGPPEFVNETDDEGILTVGLVHRMYAGRDAAGVLLDAELDRRHLEEVRTIVAALQELSREAGIDFGLELDGESVGWVERGELTPSLRVGLLETWAARFA